MRGVLHPPGPGDAIFCTSTAGRLVVEKSFAAAARAVTGAAVGAPARLRAAGSPSALTRITCAPAIARRRARAWASRTTRSSCWRWVDSPNTTKWIFFRWSRSSRRARAAALWFAAAAPAAGGRAAGRRRRRAPAVGAGVRRGRRPHPVRRLRRGRQAPPSGRSDIFVSP